MSEVDRIVESIGDINNWESPKDAIRAALIEYGGIVREECANKVEDQECDQTEYRCRAIERAATAIRNK